MAAGEPVAVAVSGLAADSLGAKQVGDVPWGVIREFVDEAVVESLLAEKISDSQRQQDDDDFVGAPGGNGVWLLCAAIATHAFRG